MDETAGAFHFFWYNACALGGESHGFRSNSSSIDRSTLPLTVWSMSLSKRNSLLLLIIAGLLFLVLAMGLPSLELSNGETFSLGQHQPEAPGNSRTSPIGDLLIWIFRGFMALGLIFLPIYIISSLLTLEGRKRLSAALVSIAILFLASEYLRKLPRNTTSNQDADMPLNLEQLLKSDPTTSFSATPPQWLTLVIILLVSLSLLTLIIVSIWFFQQRNKFRKTSWVKLAREAQNAIDSLQTGRDFKMTIVRCYQEMARVVKEERGIAREKAMTPREFEDYLVIKGLPQEPIITITRLFEQVRYGSIPVGTLEEDLAFSCLSDIVTVCQSIGKLHENQ